MPKPHETASNEEFHAFAEEWLASNVTVEQLMAVPGVAALALEEFNNKIIAAFDDDDDEDDDGDPIPGETNADYRRIRRAEDGHPE